MNFPSIPSIFGLVDKQLTSEDTEKMEKAISRGKEVSAKPISYRWYSKGGDGRYSSGEVSMDEIDQAKKQAKKQGKPSTAVRDVSYNPESGVCKVQFTGGDKYYDYRMSPSEFMQFMGASSKGRYVNNVMKYNNRM